MRTEYILIGVGSSYAIPSVDVGVDHTTNKVDGVLGADWLHSYDIGNAEYSVFLQLGASPDFGDTLMGVIPEAIEPSGISPDQMDALLAAIGNVPTVDNDAIAEATRVKLERLDGPIQETSGKFIGIDKLIKWLRQ